MADKPVRIIVYGLFPTLYSLCSPCCTRDYMSYCSPGIEEEQLKEYPEPMLKSQEALERIVNGLAGEGGNLEIEIVGADTLKGLILAARYKLGSGPAIIVGDRVFKGGELSSLDQVKRYIESLRRR